MALSPHPKKQEFYHRSLGASERRAAFSSLQKCIKVQATSNSSELPDSRGIQMRLGTFLEGMR